MPIVIDIEKDGLYRRGLEKGMEKGIEKGMEKVKVKEEKLRNAKKLKESGVAFDIISKSLGLTVEEIKKL